jgi:YggT family protein
MRADVLLYYAIQAYSWIVIVAIVMSWIPQLQESVVGRWVAAVTEPVFAQVRKVLPDTGRLDLSPLVVLLALRLIERLLF